MDEDWLFEAPLVIEINSWWGIGRQCFHVSVMQLAGREQLYSSIESYKTWGGSNSYLNEHLQTWKKVVIQVHKKL